MLLPIAAIELRYSLDPWIKRAIDVMQHIPDAENHLNQIKNYSSNRKVII